MGLDWPCFWFVQENYSTFFSQCIPAASANVMATAVPGCDRFDSSTKNLLQCMHSVASIQVVSAPSAITWEALMARRLDGPAAVVAAGT